MSPGDQKPGKAGTAPKRGKPLNIYLHDADQVGSENWLPTWHEGLRVSDAQVIKAALLLAQPDKRLLKAYMEIKVRINVQAGAIRLAGAEWTRE